jgi:hypothetical protein
VFGEEASPEPAKPSAPSPIAVKAAKISRVPLTTRIRSDLAAALKRVSLERQLQEVGPNPVQDRLESALEPWLRPNGYLS